MKICFLTSVHKRNDIRVFIKEVMSLANAGFDLSFVVADGQGDETKNGVNIYDVGKLEGRFKRAITTSNLVYKKALLLDADIYHFHDPELLRIGKKLIRKGKKAIYDVHEDVPQQILDKYWIKPFLRRTVSNIFKGYEEKAARKLTGIITATPFIRQRFEKLNANTVDIKNYPILEEFNSIDIDWQNRKNEIVYIGAINHVRGIMETLKSIESVDTKYHLAGSYFPQSYKNELMQLKAWEKTIDYGFVDRQKISEILNIAKIGILTLHPQQNIINSLPIKLFEYMSAGIPVIASNFPLWEEIVVKNNCGLCVDPMKPEELTNAINYLLQNDDIAKKMGENGKKAVMELYNWKQEEKSLIEFYKKLNT